MRFTIDKILLSILTLGILSQPAFAQVPSDCDVSAGVKVDIRQMFTAEDNGVFWDIWSHDDIVCTCIDLFYNDPVDAFLHGRVVAGAVVLLGQSEDPRAVPVLIDAIDTYPSQALYNLGNFSTVEALNALTANVRNEDVEARDNCAEALRVMKSPDGPVFETGWVDALQVAIDEVSAWITEEPELDIRDYYVDAFINLGQLLDTATTGVSGTE
ncbi:MAG: HEAT repeat domain-containing protein [bacterium]|nr:HEAT repeat domain-containing protein [bacterium]